MSRKTEQEFIEEGFSADELAAMNSDDGGSTTVTVETPQETVETQTGSDASADATVAVTPPAVEPEPKMVDVRALQEARSEIRKRDEELARTRTDQARLDERLKIINEAIAAQNAKPADVKKAPSLEDEPIEYFQNELGSLKEQLAARDKADAERAQQFQAAQQQQQLIDQADVVLGQAMASKPDLADAFQFAFKSVQDEIVRNLSRQGFSGQELAARATHMLRNEQVRYAQMCPRDPDEAAEFVHRNARYWGYQPQAAAAQVQQQAAPQQVQQPTIQQRAEQQDRHMSLSGIQGGSAPVKLDAKSLASMSDEQYNELLKTVAGQKQLAEVFGGV